MFVIPAPNPIAFNLGNFPIYWYGIIMALAILVAILVGNKLYNITNSNSRKDVIIEYAPVIILLGVFCARLYFCILNYNYYFANPLEILDIRQGGLSIHGAILGGILGMIFVAKKVNIKLMSLMDSMACATLLGQVVGRWGNYFNSEAYGLPVEGQTWGLFIPEAKRVVQYMDYSLFHPTFLYESILNFIGFIFLLFIIIHYGKKYKGMVFFSYLCAYSLIRFFIERLRVDSALDIAGGVPIAEVISLVLLLVGVLGVLAIFVRSFKKSS